MDHAILLEKLKFYGVDCLSLKWCRSYLSDRFLMDELNWERLENITP